VHGLIAQSPSGAWSSGGAILTFVIPMVLFIVVAIGLYILYTKPSIVPGRRRPNADHPVTATSLPGDPIAGHPGSPAAAQGNQAVGSGNPGTGSAVAADVRTKAGEGKKAETEGGE
jgi:hypothetical protein